MGVKQVIVVRNDLRSKLRHGKLAAQVAHASMAAVFDSGYAELNELRISMSPELKYWFTEKGTKVVLRCDDEAHLIEIYRQAQHAGLMVSLIKDAGNTVFHEPTYTCVGIGPALNEQLEPITGKLRMY